MSDFDEGKHQRDEKGRFTGGTLGAWVASKLGGKTWSDQRPAGMKAETWQAHYDKHPEQGGKPSAERAKNVQAPIIAAALNSVKPMPAGEKKVAIMTMGGPGSGKSSILKAVDKSQFVKVDPDDVRTKLPEYQAATTGAHIFRGAAAMTHEEASHISKQILAKAIEQGKQVIVDGTGKTTESMVKKMDQLKAAGYHIHLVYAHMDSVQEALQRVADRAEKEGRDVPEKVVREAYAKIPGNFEEIAKHADTFQVHNTSGTVPKGQKPPPPPMVWEKTAAGEEKQHDVDFVRMFKAGKRVTQ